MSVSNFKSHEEFEAYINESRMKYHYSCFREKDGQACHLLGDWFISKKMYKEAIQQYKMACDEHKYPRSCFKYASGVMMDHQGDKKDEFIDKALEYTELACRLGEPEGCFASANLYKRKGDFEKAFKYYDQYCSANHFFSNQACHFISTTFIQGTKVPKDMQKGYDYAQKACELNNPYSCWNLHLMYKNGDGVTKDLEKSNKYKEKAEQLRKILAGEEKEGSY